MPRRKVPSHEVPSAPSGFQEARAEFDAAAIDDSASSDAVRFAQSVALTRMFNLIDGNDDREKVISLARRLAGLQSD